MQDQALNVRHCQAPPMLSARRMFSQVMHSAAAEASSSAHQAQSEGGSVAHSVSFLFLYSMPLSMRLRHRQVHDVRGRDTTSSVLATHATGAKAKARAGLERALGCIRQRGLAMLAKGCRLRAAAPCQSNAPSTMHARPAQGSRAAAGALQQCRMQCAKQIELKSHRAHPDALLCTSRTPVTATRRSTFFALTPPPAMMAMRPCACCTSRASAVLPCSAPIGSWTSPIAITY